MAFPSPNADLQVLEEGNRDRVTKRTGTKPKRIFTDKGRQFISGTFKSWCRKRRVRPRYGAVGKQGSIAVVERFIRSTKSERCRRILVPFRLDAMRCEKNSPYMSSGTTSTARTKPWMD